MILKLIIIVSLFSDLNADARKYPQRLKPAPKFLVADFRDCEDENMLTDCSGNCFEQQYISWVGDGNCDGLDEIQGLNFYCESWNFDGGDCDYNCPGQGLNSDCDNQCFHDAFLILLGDGDCNQEGDQFDFNCPAWNYDEGDCDPSNMDPEVGQVCQGCTSESCIYDCSLNCVDGSLAISWLSDGYCDDGQWDIILDCEYFNYDGGDCSLIPCEDGFIHDCSNNCYEPDLIQDGDCHNGYETDENFNCLEYNFDGNDCGYGDCSGHLFEDSIDNFIGDGECNDGEDELNLNCELFEFDGGDCPTGPDLMVDLDYLLNTIYEDEIFVEAGDCYIEEACVSGSGLRRVIRFGTLIINVGNEDFFIGEPGGESWNWDECHQHYHYNDYAHYQLIDFENQGQHSIGFKNGWCVMDLVPYLSGAECSGYDCENQGISAGCADIYGSFLDCQWIDITDVPPGIYQFEVETNPYQNFTELDFENNYTSILIEITQDDFSIIPTDCNGEMDGTAFYDECHICAGGNTGIVPNADIDCNGDCYGTAVFDDCGECSGGHSGHAFNSGMDCMGDCAPDSPQGCTDSNGNGNCGNSIPDICGECVYGNSNMTPGWALDCAFECHGLAYEDDCGICDDIIDNDNNAMDCNYVCFGNATEDICGECNGDGWACTQLGDINQDLIINVVDVVYVVQVILEYQFLVENQQSVADLNLDGDVNIADVVLIIDIILDSAQFLYPSSSGN